MRIVAAVLVVLAGSDPVSAQDTAGLNADRLSIRPFVLVTVERFSADATFDAIFGQSIGAFVGGGVRATHRRLFVEASASQFKRTGERGFAADGEGFGLDIPLTVTITPVEVTAGYRFRPLRSWLAPYVGSGVGFYRYRETSPSAEPGEQVDLRHAGWLLVGGTEFRPHRFLALGIDLLYTSVPGILGQGGLSQEVDEPNLGGFAARFKIVIGR